MDVILKENVPGIGKAGDKVRVKDGYARNYLFPRKLAVPVTESNLKTFEQEQVAKAQRLERQRKEAEQLKTKIGQLSLTIPVLTQEKEALRQHHQPGDTEGAPGRRYRGRQGRRRAGRTDQEPGHL